MRRAMMAAAVAAAGTVSMATAETWNIDRAHSTAAFSIRHMMVSNVRGHFSDLAGTVEVEGSDPRTARIVVDIDPASIDTREPKRDEHLRSADFFDVAAYPTMRFVSRRVEGKEGAWTIVGDLTMRGVTREVVLAVDELTPVVEDPWGNQRRGISASGVIDRKDFGLAWNKLLEAGGVVVGDEVAITIDVELVKDTSESSSRDAGVVEPSVSGGRDGRGPGVVLTLGRGA